MKFVFIYSSPGVLGGIETLIVRMAKWLIKNRNNVTLILRNCDAWEDMIPDGTEIIKLGGQFKKLYYPIFLNKYILNFGLKSTDVIKSFDLSSLWIAYNIALKIGNNCKVISGLYNPFEFKRINQKPPLKLIDVEYYYIQIYLKSIPPEARILIGLDQIEELNHYYGQSGRLWPIPINEKEFIPAKRNPKWGKIVSVGRLSDMKKYNFYMVDIIKELKRRGYEINWQNYGTGEYYDEIKRRILNERINGMVQLEGAMPYKDFRKILEDAYIFIGMGTSVIEAATFGVPNVVALPYDKIGLTYGPSYTLPIGSLSHSFKCPPGRKVIDEIDRLLKMDEKEYMDEMGKVADHAKNYNVENSMIIFMKIIEGLGPIRSNKTVKMLYYLSFTVRRIIKIERKLRAIWKGNDNIKCST
jgi:glycosyltransferase involved in cell wall biosynthesis